MHDATKDVLTSSEAGGRVIRGSAVRVAANVAGIVLGLATATLLLRHLGVDGLRSLRHRALAGRRSRSASSTPGSTSRRAASWRCASPRAAATLVANILGQRLLITPLALLGDRRLRAGRGLPVARWSPAPRWPAPACSSSRSPTPLLVPLTVELRNAGLAFVDFLRQAVTLAGVALLVAARRPA